MSKGPKDPRNPMGWGNDDPRRIRETRPTMHGSRAERRLMSGLGALNKWSAEKVRVSGEKPAKGKRRP